MFQRRNVFFVPPPQPQIIKQGLSVLQRSDQALIVSRGLRRSLN